MNRVLLSIKLPITQRRYDFWVPEDMRIRMASDLISKAMAVAEPSFYSYKPNAALMLEETGQIQNPNAFVGEISVSDGSRFCLV